MAKADLHIHSSVSDGTLTPAEVIKECRNHDLDLVALTDHDTIDGLAEAVETGREIGLEVMAGTEITTDFNGDESHVLAYEFDPENPGLNALLRSHKKARIKRGKWIIERLSRQGLDIELEEAKAEANWGNLGRPHIANVLINKGYVASFKEAFIRYLGNDKLGPIPNHYTDYRETIDIIRQAGGAAVLAHPGHLYTGDQLEAFVDAGIDGLEVIHPGHPYKMQKKLRDFARNHHLLETGGSDFHGGNRDYQPYLGLVTISTEKAGKISRLSRQRKKQLVEID